MSTYAEDRRRGAAALRAGLPFDPRESVGWEHGYGDAVLIEPCDPRREEPEQ